MFSSRSNLKLMKPTGLPAFLATRKLQNGLKWRGGGKRERGGGGEERGRREGGEREEREKERARQRERERERERENNGGDKT